MDQLVPPHDATKITREKAHRLLACYTCLSIDKLPPYEGREGPGGEYLDDDPVLEHLLLGHQDHRGRIFRVDEGTWENLQARTKISQQLFADQAAQVEFRDQLKDDAHSCWKKHNRPGRDGLLNCPDFRDGSKRLGNPSKTRQSAAVAAVYLCSFCPYNSSVETEVRWRRGAYK